MAVKRVVTTRRVSANDDTVVVNNRPAASTRTSSTTVHSTDSSVPYVLSAEFIYWILGIIEGLLAIRFFFRLAGANPAAPFVQMIYAITSLFMAPFYAIFPSPRVQGSVFEASILVAMVVYWLLAWTVIKLIGIFYTADQAD